MLAQWPHKRLYIGGVALAVILFFSLRSPAPLTSHDDTLPVIRQGSLLIVPEHSLLRKEIRVEAVAEKEVSPIIVLPAIVEPDPATVVKVLSPLIGKIHTVDKRLGDFVQAGEVLFTIASADLAQAKSDVERAEALSLLAKQNLDRQKKLFSSNISATQDNEQAKNEYAQASSEYARAVARLKELQADPSSPEEYHLTVKAPVSGYIISITAAAGGYWNDLTLPTMTLADLSKIFITANAKEKDLSRLAVGQKAEVILDAYPEPLFGVVEYISPVLNPETRSVTVRISFPNPKGKLKPNMFARTKVFAVPSMRLTIPVSAVIQRGFDSIVFVEVAPWQFEAHIVQLGSQIGEEVIVHSGLKIAERVVTREGIILNG